MEDPEFSESNKLLKDLISGKAEVSLAKIYDMYREDFVKWASQKYTKLNREDFLDAFQDTCISFYEQAQSGKLNKLTCDIRTFLFGIGSRRLLNNIRKNNKIQSTDTIELFGGDHLDIISFDWDEPWFEEKKLLMGCLDELNSSCKEILNFRYIEGLNVETIMNKISYTSINAVSVSLSRCMTKLKEVIALKSKNRSNA